MLKAILRVANVLGFIAGTCSLVLLIKNGVNLGLAAPMQAMLQYYNSWIDLVFGWAEPSLRVALAQFQQVIPFDLHLYPHWKHVLVLVMILISPSARGALKFGEWFVAIACFGFGLVLSAFLGVLPVQETPQGQLLLGGAAVGSVALFFTLGAIVSTAFRARRDGISFQQAFRGDAWLQLASAIIAVVLGSILFVILNAGLVFAGL